MRATSPGRKKKRGQNKKRPRDRRLPDGEKACAAAIRGDPCPYGDDCKFLHDLKTLLAKRPPDLPPTVAERGCPHFDGRGRCAFGVTCRVGAGHVCPETGVSARKEVASPTPEAANAPPKGLLADLRGRRFRFEGGRGPPTKEPRSVRPMDFRDKVYVAPLTTVGNLPFRRVMKRFGADITCGEMALGSNIIRGAPGEWALLKRHPSEKLFGVQIASGYPDQCLKIGELIDKYCKVDFVDMNLGCPIDMICDKHQAGARLMMRENKLKGCVQNLTSVLNVPITIKMRTGWDEAKPIANKLIGKIQHWAQNDLPPDSISAFMLHGRSRLQRYSRLANWDYIRTVASTPAEATDMSPDARPRIPLIGNGDIFSYTDYETHVLHARDEGIDGLLPCAMLGRGALIKPWLPTEIHERRHWDISASERLDVLKDFCHFGLEHWGSDQQGVDRTRRFLLEWLSFLYRYVPVGLLEVCGSQKMNHRPPPHMCGRNDLETLMLSNHCADWIKLSEMLLGPVPEGFQFLPKHKANAY